MSPPLVAIPAYHKVGAPGPGAWETWFYVPEATFARQLEDLLAAGFAPIGLADLLAGLRDPGRLPERAALVTFDDAFRSVRTVALPLLERFGFPATVFVPTDFVGGTNGFDRGAEPSEPLCDWDDLRALEEAGVSIQSHGASHRRFSELPSGAVAAELVRSKWVLEERLGTRVEALAYPFGDSGRSPARTVAALERGGYRAAFLYKGGPVWLRPGVPSAERFKLTRIPMGPDTDLRERFTRTEAPREPLTAAAPPPSQGPRRRPPRASAPPRRAGTAGSAGC